MSRKEKIAPRARNAARVTEFHLTHCAYCVEPLQELDIVSHRGVFRVHTSCEMEKRRLGGTYLLPDGQMRLRSHTIDADFAMAAVTLHMNMRRESIEREKLETLRYGM